MSAFSKSHLGGFDTTGPSQEPVYSYAPPSFASPQHQVSLSTEPHAPNSQPVSLMGGSQYQVRSPYEGQASPYIEMRPRQIPEIKSFKPIKGSDGTKIFVYLQTLDDFTAFPSISFSLMFHSRRCNTVLTKTGQQGPLHQYTLSADVPPLSTTGWSEPQITVFMHMEDEDGQLLGEAAVGDFTFMNTAPRTSYSTPSAQINPRKRKGSTEPLDTMRSPAKRQASQQLRPKSGEEYPQYSYQPSAGSPYSPYLQNPTSQGQYQYVPGYERPDPQGRYGQLASPRQFPQNYQFPATSAVQQPPIKAPSPRTPSWSPSTYHAVGSQAGRSPAIAAQTRHVSAPLPAPAVPANPPLIRTSTLQQSPSPASTPAGAAQAGQQFNPYAMLYPHKAVLKISGELDSLAENWSLEEWEAKRRIVQFWRHQNGSAIHTNFAPVAPNERPPNSICISCIWWEEKKECYVTSVDTIYLLESLVAVRFTVEEKNRIRRNLEGFRPLTVSKAKSDSEEFFKLIMAFPNPKPRNIEKDVKVFPWKILAHALKKIIGKYSASYSSTAGALLTPVNSSSYGNGGAAGVANSSEASSNAVDRHITASPRSASDSTSSSIYTAGITTTSPSIKQPVETQVRGGGPPDLRVAVPTVRTSSVSSAPAAWPQAHMHSAQSQQDINPSGRVSWDFNSYIDTSPASATPGGSQALHYQRGVGMPMPDHRESNLVPPPKSHQISGA